MNCFVLSTPDLSASPLSPWLCDRLKVSNGSLQAESAHSIHQNILSDLQKSWYEEIPLVTESDNYSNFQQNIKGHAEEFLDQDSLIYGPLLCHFLPTWRTVYEDPKVVLHYSDPLTCALSLQNSWRMPLAVGLALWESYIIQACKNIKDLDYLLLPAEKLSRSDDSVLTQITSYLDIEHSHTTSKQLFHWSDPSQHGHQHEQILSCLQNAQIEILELLYKGDVGTVAKRELAYSSANTLEYYGQLRGALELSNTSRDNYKNMNSENTSAPQMRAIDEVHANTSLQADATQNQLCNVKVQIQGMKALEFVSPADSPTLDMLRSHLIQNSSDELIFLNYGEVGNEALYFMSSSLIAIETQPV